ncbi:MAG: hypothetical protein GX957_06150 [Clostridiaceae bacterium]|nr:hypothetical protein [Clostridiaceae bacterium]
MDNDIKNTSFAYSVNMLKLLLKTKLLTEEEYKEIVKISAEYYGSENIYV